MGSKSGTMLNNGFNSYRLIPKGDSDALDDKIAEAVDGYADDISSTLSTLNNDANNLKDRVLNLSNNLETIHLSDAIQGEISSAIVQGTATFVTNNQAGAWYGLQIIQDAGGTEYISGFDMGALLNPSAGVNESYFRINADTFIVGGDLGDGNGYTGPTDINGEPIPAFSIIQDDEGSPQMYFNGKVNIQAIPESVNNYLGKYTDFAALEEYLEDNPGVSVSEGDTYLNDTEQVVYMWDGDEWISTESKISYRSVVFKRADTKPDTPVGGNYSDSVPSGWSDGIPPHPTGWTTGMAIIPIWASYSEFDNKTDYTDNPPVWTEPILTLDSATTDYLYHSSITTPPTPINTTDDTSIIQEDIDNGWYNEASADTIWAAVRHKQQGVWTTWELTKIKGEKGSDGASPVIGVDYFIDGSKYQATMYKEVVNGTDIQGLALPTGASFDGSSTVTSTNGWTDSPTISDSTGSYIALTMALFEQDSTTGVWALSGSWSIPQKYTLEKGVDYFDGAAGTYTSYIYKVGTSVTTPTGGSFTGSVATEVIPSTWTTNPSYGVNDTVWISSMVYEQEAAGSSVWNQVGTWKTPGRFYLRGETGASGSNGYNGSRGSAILHGEGYGSFSSSDATDAFNDKFGYLVTGDQYIWASTNYGTVIRTYNGSYWTDNTALTVHGDAIIEGTLVADKVFSNGKIQGCAGEFDTSLGVAYSSAGGYGETWAATFTGTGSHGGTYALGYTYGAVGEAKSSNGASVVGWGFTAGATGVLGNTKYTSKAGVRGDRRPYDPAKSQGIGDIAEFGALAYLSHGVYTPNSAYIGGTTYPFTGSHIGLTLDVNGMMGDIFTVSSSLLLNVDQTVPYLKLADSSKNTTVFGILNSDTYKTIEDMIATVSYIVDVDSETDERTVKPEYQDVVEFLMDNNYMAAHVNAIGEGGVNVCAVNGNIHNGDYITSSTVAGKGMKQDDDLMHSYTVAKALEDVIWDDEVVGEGGCFEQNGVKCKMISCTYHCG